MINAEEDSIEKVARDVREAGDDVNVFEVEARLSSLLSRAKFKLVEANDQVEHINLAIEDIGGYNDSTEFLVNEAKQIIKGVEEDYPSIVINT